MEEKEPEKALEAFESDFNKPDYTDFIFLTFPSASALDMAHLSVIKAGTALVSIAVTSADGQQTRKRTGGEIERRKLSSFQTGRKEKKKNEYFSANVSPEDRRPDGGQWL